MRFVLFLYRYMILYHYGGIYLDMDECCVKSMDLLVKEMDISGQTVLLPEGHPFGVGNNVIISTKNNKFLEHILSHLSEANRWYILPYITVMWSTGTVFLTNKHNEYKQIDPEYKYKILSWKNRTGLYLNNRMGRSWLHWDGVIINFVDDWKNIFVPIAVVLMLSIVVLRMHPKFSFKMLRKLFRWHTLRC